MKATLYQEKEQAMEPIDEHRMAIATEKPAKADPPRQQYYMARYETLVKPTVIAAVILVVFALALWLL